MFSSVFINQNKKTDLSKISVTEQGANNIRILLAAMLEKAKSEHDGVQEEISQGVGRITGCLGLSNFTMFYDSINIHLFTSVEDVTAEDAAKEN